MTPIYLYLLLGSLAVPLLFSVFYLDFIEHWKNFILSTSIVAAVFLIWDAIFTHLHIWEFNPNYCIGFTIFKMPIEEWLFFFIIPFCSLFIHFALLFSFPKLSFSKKVTRYIAITFIVITIIVLGFNISKAYTATTSILWILVLALGIIFYMKLLQRFFLSFMLILIPFFIVNGILTGALTDFPIVSYNDSENLGLRIWTIPIEDLGYAFIMLFGNLMIFEFLNKKNNSTAHVPVSQ